jgi:DNA-binding MarR family transcriptional regulator
MDRTTLTANIKPLERLGLIEVGRVAADKRQRTLVLTPAGRSALAAAMPLWQRTHDNIENLLRESGPDRLRTDLRALS